MEQKTQCGVFKLKHSHGDILQQAHSHSSCTVGLEHVFPGVKEGTPEIPELPLWSGNWYLTVEHVHTLIQRRLSQEHTPDLLHIMHQASQGVEHLSPLLSVTENQQPLHLG